MKPLKLIMQAFGTFTLETTIDFKSLNDKVFLIYGKTGSGKTTIFDAICYALYGEVTGDLRNKDTNKNIRSTNALNTCPTYVEYTFEIKSDIYKIKRIPGGQDIYKHKTEYSSEKALLYKNDQLLDIKKVNDINKYIKENVIKLSREQFKQTMMISQGDFAALIKADSKDRTEIFRNILNTYNIDSCSQVLKQKTNELNSNCSVARNSLISAIGMLSKELFDEDYYKNKVSNSNSYTISDEICDKANEALAQKISEKLEYEKEKNNLLKEKDLENKNLGIANINNKNKTNYNNAKTEETNLISNKQYIENLRTKLDLSEKANEIKEKYVIYQKDFLNFNNNENQITINQNKLNDLKANEETIYNNYKKVDSLNAEKEELLKKLQDNKTLSEKFDGLNRLEKDYKSNLLKQKQCIEKKNEINDKYEKALQKFSEAQKYVNENSSIISKLSENTNKLKEQEELLKKSDDTFYEYNKLTTVEEKIQQQKIELSKLKLEKDKKEIVYLETKANFIKNQAGILAKELKENTPCPVCGSVNHPHPCVSDIFITKEDVDAKEKALKKIQDLYNSNSSKIESDYNVLQANKSNLVAKIYNDFKLNVVFDTILLSLRDNKKNIDKLILELSNQQKQLNIDYNLYNEKRKIVEDNTIISNLKNQLDEEVKKLDIANNEVSASKAKFEALKEELSTTDINDLIIESNRLDSKKKNIEQTINSYTNVKNKYEKDVSICKNIIDSAISNKENLTNNLNDSKTKLEALEYTYNINRNDYTSYIINHIDTSSYQNEVKQYDDSVIKNSGVLADYLKNGYDKLDFISIDEIQAKINELSQKIKELENKITTIDNLIYTTNNYLKTISKVYLEYLQKSKEYTPYKELSDTFNGEIVGKDRISFETFYQVQFFKQILSLATKRFSTMTDGKYEIVYKDSGIKGNAKAGLDMEVLDNYNGTRRNIGTLSGGESFMASLSLALSMSDIIQSTSGGITLDSMFIDEGFGTLDSDALNNAITEIAKLSVNGKTIGLISHVEELKNRITTQICVEKKENGSVITIK